MCDENMRKKMKKIPAIFFYLAFAFCAFSTFFTAAAAAGEQQEAIYLQQLLNQLNAMQPLIMAAQAEQPKDTRIQFHYTRYRDANGRERNGLLEDVNAIKGGIEQKLNQVGAEPRTSAPIKGDYLPTTASTGSGK
jgi:RAQPRD family integrative conjugative element protein